MRALAVAVAIALAIVSAGCLQQGTVRAALLEETVVLGPNAPASALERIAPFRGCSPGEYDPEERIIRFQPRDYHPRFAVVLPIEGGHTVMAAGNGGPFDMDMGIIDEQGTSGAWGFGSPFASGPDTLVRLTWGRTGATFEGVDLEEGVPVERSFAYNATWENETFSVEQTYRATYLGRLPYVEEAFC